MSIGIKDGWRALRQQITAEVAIRDAEGERYLHQEVLKGIVASSTILILYCLILTLEFSVVWLLLWASLGVISFFLIVNCAHDASHRVLFNSVFLNECALLLPFALLGIDGALWGLRHRSAHHPHTNVSGEDTDSVSNPFLRLSPYHPWRRQFSFQHIYAPILYGLALPHTAFVQDVEHLIFRPLPYLSKIRSLPLAWMRLVLVKMSYVGLFVVLPITCGDHALAHVLTGIAFQHVTASLVFVFTICLNHYVCETTFFAADPERTHLEHQLLASADWYPTSRFWCWVMGGANAHTAHHLFPGIPHRHYWWISARIRDFCEEYSLPYNSFTFVSGLRSHFRFLIQLGKGASQT